MPATITPQNLRDRVDAGESVDLIDVRTPMEFREVHVGFARNIPLDRLDPQSVASARADDPSPLYVICRSGSRGEKARQILANVGLDVVNVEGGTQAWDQAGLPVVRGRKAISLERQVRIAAGAIVVAGSALAWFVHPALLAIPAFVGAGLIFAGVTDSCAMGMLLARMPWNQIRTATPSSSASGSPDLSAQARPATPSKCC